MTKKDSQTSLNIKRKRKRLYEQSTEDEPLIYKDLLTSSKKSLYNIQSDQARQIVREYTKLSAGTGLLPIPYVDMIIIKSIGLKMLKKLCRLYDVPFSKKRVKILITSLAQEVYAGLWAPSLVKFVPVIGSAGGGITMLYRAGKATHKIGMMFVRHFETGGTLQDFMPSKKP